jgi:hypothetical protein
MRSLTKIVSLIVVYFFLLRLMGYAVLRDLNRLRITIATVCRATNIAIDDAMISAKQANLGLYP